MPSVDVRTPDGKTNGSVELAESIFGIAPNVPVMHQVVTAQLAAARAGTQSTLTRAEVRGGGAKPWRQKGTGRARQGSIRAPHWAGGGVALGPKPRSYRQKTPKKMVQLALRSALSDRASDGKVVVVDGWAFTTPRTRDARVALKAIGVDGKVLVVVTREDENAALSFRNLPEVHVLLASELNAYDILCSDWVVFTRASLPMPSGTDRGGTPDMVVEPDAQPGAETAAQAGRLGETGLVVGDDDIDAAPAGPTAAEAGRLGETGLAIGEQGTGATPVAEPTTPSSSTPASTGAAAPGGASDVVDDDTPVAGAGALAGEAALAEETGLSLGDDTTEEA